MHPWLQEEDGSEQHKCNLKHSVNKDLTSLSLLNVQNILFLMTHLKHNEIWSLNEDRPEVQSEVKSPIQKSTS